MYEDLIKRLRNVSIELGQVDHVSVLLLEAADAIEELLKVASAMHTWIFLNTGDEQKAYDECGLSDEMNAALGYIGQFVAETAKRGRKLMYDELIKGLQEDAEWAEDNEWETPITLSDHLKQAADVIEELSKRSECPCWYGGIRFCSMLGKPIPEPPKEEST